MRDVCQREMQEAPIGIEMVNPKSREEEGNVQEKYQLESRRLLLTQRRGTWTTERNRTCRANDSVNAGGSYWQRETGNSDNWKEQKV